MVFAAVPEDRVSRVLEEFDEDGDPNEVYLFHVHDVQCLFKVSKCAKVICRDIAEGDFNSDDLRALAAALDRLREAV